MLYRILFKLVFTKFDPEWIHHVIARLLIIGSNLRLTRIFRLSKNQVSNVNVLGLNFKGPFGLAAGFDKDGKLIEPLHDLGFSHVEVGTVTAIAQPGNEKPRLFRLTKDHALINRMGFNNLGAAALAKRLEKLRSSGRNLPVIGVNIGKSKVTPLDRAIGDYETSTSLLAKFADYLAVNVSSPNTPGLRDLQAISSLEPILAAVTAKAEGKPVFVKIAPDLADSDIQEVADLAVRLGLAGIIATNTTISRAGLETKPAAVEKLGAGGLSGAPLKARSLEVLRILNQRLAGRAVIISVGGVETVEDVRERIRLGATLVQGYTGFVYQGPLWARKINKKLAN